MFKRLNLPLIIAVVLILVAGIGYYRAFIGAQDTVDVVAAATDLPPFIAVQQNQLGHVSLSHSSVRPGDMTWAYYNAHYGSKAGSARQQIIPVYAVVAGQVLDINVLAKSPQESFSIVLPDERVVAVTSSLAGSALGTIQPGDVVDAQTSNNGGSSVAASFAKVLCISTSATGCRGVLPAGENVVSGIKSSNTSSGGPINILLVVAASDANQLAGQDVSLSLNTQCGIDQYGYFTQARASYPCVAPQGRDASQGATKSPVQKTTTSTTTTGTATTTTPATTTTGTSTASTTTSQNTTTTKP